MKKAVSIVIPTLNEEQNIMPLVKRIDTVCKKNSITYELIFIDDHSTDKTRVIISSLASAYPVRLYSKKGMQGKAQSIMEGSQYAEYPLIAMIDADLQYPPEVLPQMISEIVQDKDIVIANRNQQHTSIVRQLFSRSFSFVFAKLLHNLDYDVQSGLKIFRKEIIKRLKLKPSPWTFDLEFLLKARNGGYRLGSIDIVFNKRYWGKTKVNLLKTSWEIGSNALRLKFSPLEIEPFDNDTEKKKGVGFHYKGVEFIDHTKLHYKESAFFGLSSSQKLFILLLGSLFVLGLVINWHSTIILFIGILTFIYFTDLLFNFYLIFRSFVGSPEIIVSSDEIAEHEGREWPMYTVLCPLYKEWQIIPQFVHAMNQLDYPKDKLQIILLLEEDDRETIQKVDEFILPEFFQVLIVPQSQPKTKPKALNYGLQFTKGKYTVIYDAEDVPEQKQLKKAVLAFERSGRTVACIQAKLNFYNSRQNLLTRIFTAEYSLWFDLILTGLQSLQAPIPLGGTSNHFRTKDLVHFKGWDPFNVTEDCDLGMRLVKRGYSTAIIDSTTFEEANSSIRNWFPQRTRWIKGYIQTYLVHMRHPVQLFDRWRVRDVFSFQLVVGAKILSMFINPIMWVLTFTYFAFRATTGALIESLFPSYIFYIAALSFVFGNFLYFYYYMIGCAKRGHFDLIKYVYVIPVYWIGMSICAWRALVELVYKPHYWAKTVHGLHLNQEFATDHISPIQNRQYAIPKHKYLDDTPRVNVNKTG